VVGEHTEIEGAAHADWTQRGSRSLEGERRVLALLRGGSGVGSLRKFVRERGLLRIRGALRHRPLSPCAPTGNLPRAVRQDIIDYETFWILTFSAVVLGSGIFALFSISQNSPNGFP
jgi:hypothetical protein